jgi:hypothetical protein
MLDNGGELLGQGTVGDLPFWIIEAQAVRGIFLSTPQGYLIRGKVYDPEGTLRFDTDAARPIPSHERAAGALGAGGGAAEKCRRNADALVRNRTPCARRGKGICARSLRSRTGQSSGWRLSRCRHDRFPRRR